MTSLAQVKPWIPSSATVRRYIISRLRSVGIRPDLMPFRTFLSSGMNVIVDINRGEVSQEGPIRMIGAHYDGHELYDNLGSVFCLIDVATSLYLGHTRHAWRIAFWDAEESFQQGSTAYLTQARMRADAMRRGQVDSESFMSDGVYLDVDGMGIDVRLFAREVDNHGDKLRHFNSEFLLDADVFARHGISTFHIFSGPQEFRDIYAINGLLGCHLALRQSEHQTLQNWRRAMPSCRQAMTKLVAAWEDLSLESALAETGVICLTT